MPFQVNQDIFFGEAISREEVQPETQNPKSCTTQQECPPTNNKKHKSFLDIINYPG